MTEQPDLKAVTQVQQQIWSKGDFAMVANIVYNASENLAEALELVPDERVLDVACGSGNGAIAAARRTWGGTVGADYVPELLERGRERAFAERLEIEFIEADAQDLPFEDGGYDAALSAFGAMFAPDQPKAASELLRVAAPGGVAAMTAWVPEGPQAEAMAVISSQFPERPPMMNEWGKPDIARAHFMAAGASSVEIERRETHWEFATRQEWLDFVSRGPGPMVAAIPVLGDRWPAVRDEMLACLPDGEPFVINSPYLVIAARR